MPKLIEGLKERILDETRTVLFEKGLEAVTVRTIAQNLSIAPGTIYNYFRSKEMLLAFVFLEDWNKLRDETKGEVAEAANPIEVCALVFEAIKRYTLRFSPIWSQSSVNFSADNGKRHELLKGQIAEILSSSPFFKEEWTRGENLFISEILLSYGAGRPVEFSTIQPFLERLVK